MRYKSDPDGLGGMVAALLVISATVLAVASFFGLVVVVLAGFLIVTVLKARPNSVPVWIALSFFCLFVLLSLITHGQAVALILCLISFVAVLIACFVEKARHPQLFEKAERPLVINDLIRNQWWNEPDTEDEPDDEDQQQAI